MKSPSVIYTYELNFTITHSLFKMQSQIFSKLHQLSFKKSQWIYVQDKICAYFNKKKGKKKFTFPIFDSSRLKE